MLTQALCCRFICNIHRAGRYVRISWGKYSWEDFTNSNNSTANLCQQRKTGGLGNKRNGGCFYGLYDLYCAFNSFYLYIHDFFMHITATDINRRKQVGKERTETEGVLYDFYCELNSYHLFIHTFTCLLNFWKKQWLISTEKRWVRRVFFIPSWRSCVFIFNLFIYIVFLDILEIKQWPMSTE